MDEEHSTNETVRTARTLDLDRKSKIISEIRIRARPVAIEPLSIDPHLAKWLPAHSARQIGAVPIAEEHGKPVIAVGHPVGDEVLELLRQVPNCVIVTAPKEQIVRAIGELYW